MTQQVIDTPVVPEPRRNAHPGPGRAETLDAGSPLSRAPRAKRDRAPAARPSRESLLSRVSRGKQPGPRRVLVYGMHGVGKSTFASQAPDAVFLPTEDGTGDLDCTRLPLLESYDDALRAVSELLREPHGFRTVVIDSLDWLERMIWEKVCVEHRVKGIEDFPYKIGYTHAVDHWRRLLKGFDLLRRERDMTVVLIAHSRVERFESPDMPSYDRYVPSIHRLAADLVQEWCDEVLFASFRVSTRTVTEKFNRKRTQGVSSGERILRTTERASHKAKNRLGLPEELPLDWSAYARHFDDRARDPRHFDPESETE